MKKYKCNKVVEAMRIGDMLSNDLTGGATLIDIDHDADPAEEIMRIYVDEYYVGKHNPQIGGYYVRYEDGYESFSPAKAFEDGYTPML